MFDGVMVGCLPMRSEGQDVTDPRTVAAHGERLAVVETKVDSLSDDTKVIRSMQHGINENLQKIFIMEQNCERSLVELKTLTRDLPTIAAATAAFTQIKDEIAAVLVERQRRRGAIKVIMALGAALVGLASIIGVGINYLFGRIH